MEYDISFCTPPDWHRESSINPDFIFAVVLAVLLLFTFYLYTMANRRFHRLERELNTIRAEVEKTTPEVDSLQSLQEETRLWRQMLDKLEGKSENRHFWSRQMEALQKLVPPDIVLTNFAIRGESVRVEIPAPPPPSGQRKGGRQRPTIEYYTIYRLHITALATGENVEQDIADFADSIGSCETIGEKLEGYEIRNISSPSGAHRELYPQARSFVLECSYKQIPEIM